MRFKKRSFDGAAAVLEVKDLTVKLVDNETAPPVLDRVSLSIRSGETACLVGESGSGKSVTSLAIMGLLPKGALAASGGRIELEGKNLLELGPQAMRELRASRISMVFQEPMTALNPVMRVGDQIECYSRVEVARTLQ